MTPRDNLLKTLLGKADIPWFTDGPNLKNENGKYCAGYAVVIPFEVVKAASLPLSTSAQQAELYAPT